MGRRRPGRVSLLSRIAAVVGALVLGGATGGGMAAAAMPMSPAQVAALGHLTPWQVQWLETGGASGVPGLIPPTGTAPAAAPMQPVTLVSAWSPAGFQATQTVDGSCWTGSIAAPRAGAYRCTVGNGILDPCFALAGGQAVACPTGNPADHRGTLIRLTSALPAGNSAPPSPQHPWYFTLSDLGTCGAMTGTVVSPDHPFGCLIPASPTAARQSVYCTAPARDGSAYTVRCAPLSSQRAADGAPQLGAETTHQVVRMWT